MQNSPLQLVYNLSIFIQLYFQGFPFGFLGLGLLSFWSRRPDCSGHQMDLSRSVVTPESPGTLKVGFCTWVSWEPGDALPRHTCSCSNHSSSILVQPRPTSHQQHLTKSLFQQGHPYPHPHLTLVQTQEELIVDKRS